VVHFVDRLERDAAALVAGVASDGAGRNVFGAAPQSFAGGANMTTIMTGRTGYVRHRRMVHFVDRLERGTAALVTGVAADC